ncbi:MAG: LCP family protein [Alicyclobacillus sp.]|nr:LCP family protein [Alicyclobacillus sp.]
MAGRHARKRREEKERNSRRRVLWMGGSIAAVVVALGAGGYYWMTRPLTHHVAYPKFPGIDTAAKSTNDTAGPPAEEDGRLNVLLIGTDTRPGETGGNTDSLILASIDPADHRIALMSIPRDTKVLYPDGSYAKINEALSLGGPALLENLVTGLTGQPIDHYALTHFGGLVDIINTIHGVTVNVPERMYYNTGDKQYNLINLRPGVQTLNGQQALGFVRFRHDALGDIGRTERQQAFLRALTQKLLQPSNIVQLPTLIREFWGTLDTDMSMLNVLQLASHAEQYKGYDIITETLPGSFHNPDPKIPGDESYWIVNPLEAKYVSNQFFTAGVVQKNPIQDPTVTANWAPPASSSAEGGGNQAASPGPSSGNSANAASAASTSPEADGQNESGTAGSSGGAFPVQPTAPHPMLVPPEGANIRSGPDTTYPIIASVAGGASVEVLGTSGSWDEVSVSGGGVGFIADWLLSDPG